MSASGAAAIRSWKSTSSVSLPFASPCPYFVCVDKLRAQHSRGDDLDARRPLAVRGHLHGEAEPSIKLGLRRGRGDPRLAHKVLAW